MTAVEFLADEIIMLEERLRQEEINLNDFMDLKDDLVTKALKMEKEQMLNAFQESRLTHPMIGFKHETFVEYYKQFKQQEQ